VVAHFFESIDNYLWAYLAVPLLMVLGFYLSYTTRFKQLRQVPYVLTTFGNFIKIWDSKAQAATPFRKLIDTMGGCTGIGNVVAICTAVQVGGPGALFWIWITALAGMTLKYAEVYLGVRFRESDGKGGYKGGPMFYLKRVFKSTAIPTVACILLCVYGVEIYQFSIITNSLTINYDLNRMWVVVPLVIAIVGASFSFFDKVRQYLLMVVPLFFCIFFAMSVWVLILHISEIPEVLSVIIRSAFTGHAAVGAFAGSSLLITASQGIRRGCYAGDVGIGYASMVHSRHKDAEPEKQASLAVFDIFLDSFIICTTSVILVIVTGAWKEPVDASLLIQTALSYHLPMMDIFMPVFLLLLGFVTTSTYFNYGLSFARHLSPRHGRWLYYFYGVLALYGFAYLKTTHALLVMSLTGGILLLINLYAIFNLRHEIQFKDNTKKDIGKDSQQSTLICQESIEQQEIA
jgi:AGCS family alanine or glycine:cation symporter